MNDEQAVRIYILGKAIKDDHFGGKSLSEMYTTIAELEQEVGKIHKEMYRQSNARQEDQ